MLLIEIRAYARSSLFPLVFFLWFVCVFNVHTSCIVHNRIGVLIWLDEKPNSNKAIDKEWYAKTKRIRKEKRYTYLFIYFLFLSSSLSFSKTKNQPREDTCGFKQPNAMNSSGKIHRNMKTRENNHKTMYLQNEMRRMIGYGIPLAKCACWSFYFIFTLWISFSQCCKEAHFSPFCDIFEYFVSFSKINWKKEKKTKTEESICLSISGWRLNLPLYIFFF